MESAETAKAPHSFSFITHTDTRHLRWATCFAQLVAFCNRRDELFPSDLLAGIYVANFDRISKFWPNPNLFDDFVAEHCDWSEPRWMTWQRWDDELRKATRRWHLPFRISLPWLRKPSKQFYGSMFRGSPDWQRLFDTGEKLTPYKVSERGRLLPLLTPEIMLLAFIRTDDLPLGKHLEETGLLMDELENAAKRHIEHSEKLMF
jgi:hypothetical protein